MLLFFVPYDIFNVFYDIVITRILTPTFVSLKAVFNYKHEQYTIMGTRVHRSATTLRLGRPVDVMLCDVSRSNQNNFKYALVK